MQRNILPSVKLVVISVREMGTRPPRSRRERSDAVDDDTREEREIHEQNIFELETNEKDLVLAEKIKAVIYFSFN